MKRFSAALLAALGPVALLAASAQRSAVPAATAGDSCSRIGAERLAGAVITMAEVVSAGAFTPPGAVNSGRGFAALPPFCRVAATLAPSADSEIKIEVWLPVGGWNGKFQAVGNGAFNGNLAYAAMGSALADGYATASTDTGHTGGSASFGLGHPEKVIDFGWRAVHEMTVAAKHIVGIYYDAAPKFSYWNGCSAGGRQALKEAQRFPADYDGIIAGAPGLDWTGRAARAVHAAQALQRDEAARLSAPKRQALHDAVLAACDAGDGIRDGLLENPERCSYDPAALQCRGADGDACLTAAQVGTARMLYAPLPNPKTGRAITGLARGSEIGWTDLGWTASARSSGLEQFRFLVFKDPKWDIERFAFDTDIVRAEAEDANTLNALDPNLAPFIAEGGKLIQYHGWSDPQISPGNSTQYYDRVVEAVGDAAKVGGGYRLFMAPGMGHCGGGDGPNSFDMVAALEQWVEQGKAPDRIIASRVVSGQVVRSRPLCPYPQVARFTGTGSGDEASSFVCAAP
jgi:feruloyl esterase